LYVFGLKRVNKLLQIQKNSIKKIWIFRERNQYFHYYRKKKVKNIFWSTEVKDDFALAMTVTLELRTSFLKLLWFLFL
jgi:hypothetical protein